MTAEQWLHAVAASVTPVVIISASALMCLALYNRLAAIVSRLRAVQRERLELRERVEGLTPKEIEAGASFRLTCILESLANQTARIRRRARLIRNALLCLMGAIGSLVICSLLNGLAIFVADLTPIAAGMFLLGLLMMFCSVICASTELTLALAPAEFETDIVSELTGTGESTGTPVTTRMMAQRDALVEAAQAAGG